MNGPTPANLRVLFEPITINRMVVDNRIVMGPIAANSPAADGTPSDQTVAFFEARARGGVGMIIVGGGVATTRAWEECPFQPVLRLDRDDVVSAYRRLTEAVHRHGTKIIYEASASFGRMAKPGPGRPQLISASASNVTIPEDQFARGLLVPGGIRTPMAREATLEEIEGVEDGMARCALRSRMAGFDGVEIAAHMSYFLASFLTPRSNRRADPYGGSRENRARVLVNIVRKMRALVGRDYVIGLRIPCAEHVPGGQGPEEYAQIAALVEQAGIDYVAMVDGCYESMKESAAEEDGTQLKYGEPPIFRKALTVPTLLSNAHDPYLAARAIAQGEADMTMLARQMLADPDYANKVRAGTIDAIVRCRRDNLCMRRMIMGFPVRCEANPRMGREAREPGQWPPIGRMMKAPIEQAVLGLTGSPAFMRLAARLKGGPGQE
jgi:2,4-dienoyl-CoA reductase (NADPH2)